MMDTHNRTTPTTDTSIFQTGTVLLLQYQQNEGRFIIIDHSPSLSPPLRGRELEGLLSPDEWEIVHAHLSRLNEPSSPGSLTFVHQKSQVLIRLQTLQSGTILLLVDGYEQDQERLSWNSRYTSENEADMISCFDAALKFTFVSLPSRTITGYDMEALIGHSLYEFCYHADQKTLSFFIKDIIGSPKIDRIRYRIRDKEGVNHWFETIFASIFSSEGKFIEIQAMSREMETTFRADQAVRNANVMLNTCNSLIRHDILNQATAFLGYLEIIEEMVQDKSILSLVEKEKKIGDTIIRLISTTQRDQGIGTRPPSWQNVDAIVHKIFCRSTPDPLIESDQMTGLYIYADRLFEAVISHIVDICRKESKDTEIRFWYEIKDADLIVHITAPGKGYDHAEKEQLFTPSMGPDRDYGLYIATEILDITGIQIRESGMSGEIQFDIIVPRGEYQIQNG